MNTTQETHLFTTLREISNSYIGIKTYVIPVMSIFFVIFPHKITSIGNRGVQMIYNTSQINQSYKPLTSKKPMSICEERLLPSLFPLFFTIGFMGYTPQKVFPYSQKTFFICTQQEIQSGAGGNQIKAITFFDLYSAESQLGNLT